MRHWRYSPEADLDRTFFERLRGFHRRPEMSVHLLRSLASLFLRGWLKLYHRLEIAGRENLPARGSYVLVANHASHLDALCLLSAVPLHKVQRTFPAAAKDYFFGHLPATVASATFLNALPFDRKADSAGSLDACRRLLAHPGNVLILFPEGTRSSSGELGRFRSGIGRLLAGTDIPVLPCYLDGASKAWPKGRLLPLPRKLRLTLGPPRSYPETATDREGCQSVAADLQAAVQRLASIRLRR